MAINYVVRKKVDTSGEEKKERYYAAAKAVQNKPVSNEEIAARMAEMSSLQAGDALSALAQLPDIIADFLGEGRTVNIQGLGNFFPAITSKPVEKVEECSADKVSVSRICFKAAARFLQRVRKAGVYSIEMIELRKEIKKGSNEVKE